MKTSDIMTVAIPRGHLYEARIPKLQQGLGVDTYVADEKALLATQSYIRGHRIALQRGVGLTFFGERYSGKTFLLCYALRMLMLEGRSCFYVTLDELTEAMMTNKEPFEQSIMDLIRTIDFLAVDQIMANGDEKPNRGKKDSLVELIRSRQSQGRPTFFATDFAMSPVKGMPNFWTYYGNELHKDIDDSTISIHCKIDPLKQNQIVKDKKEGVLL